MGVQGAEFKEFRGKQLKVWYFKAILTKMGPNIGGGAKTYSQCFNILVGGAIAPVAPNFLRLCEDLEVENSTIWYFFSKIV